MQTKDAIKFALTVSNGAVLSVIEEMSDAATTFPTPNGGCHSLWVLGHLTLVEGMIPAVFFGDKNPAAEWQHYFGGNSEPVADPSAYPPFAEVREKYRQLREQNLKLLESMSENTTRIFLKVGILTPRGATKEQPENHIQTCPRLLQSEWRTGKYFDIPASAQIQSSAYRGSLEDRAPQFDFERRSSVTCDPF